MTDSREPGVGSCGVWTRRQALAVLSAAQVRALLRGAWQVVLPGVYADAGYQLDADQRAFAAVLASGGAGQPLPFGAPDPETGVRRTRVIAVACGRTAARVWRLPLVDDDPATGACEARIDDVATWTDTRILTTGQLEKAVAARHGLAGAPALRRAVGLADGRAEAPSETLARLLLLPVLPGLRPQLTLRDGRGRSIARFDLADEEVKLAVEADGKAGHAGEQMVAKDRRRDRRTDARLGDRAGDLVRRTTSAGRDGRGWWQPTPPGAGRSAGDRCATHRACRAADAG